MTIFDRGGMRDDAPFEMRRAGPLMKYAAIVLGAFLVLLFLSVFLIRVTRIEAGHVGVEINLAGKQRGASEIPVRTGWVFYSPLRTQIIQFPTYVQTV
jgi:hypothetical protein